MSRQEIPGMDSTLVDSVRLGWSAMDQMVDFVFAVTAAVTKVRVVAPARLMARGLLLR